MMGMPVTTTSGGICFAFPNVCWTKVPPPPSEVPIPYPSIGRLDEAETTGDAPSVYAGAQQVVTQVFEIKNTTGDEASERGVVSGTKSGKVEFATASLTVFAQGSSVVRLGDTTLQNAGNAQGTVLGGFPTVTVGG